MLGSTMLQSLASIGGAATVSKLLLSSDERPAMEEETLTSSSSEREVGNCSGSTVVLVVLSGDEVIIEFLQICDDGVVDDATPGGKRSNILATKVVERALFFLLVALQGPFKYWKPLSSSCLVVRD
jgi:hypothetical protein